MLFNSPVFLFAFLPITFATYFALNGIRRTSLAKAWLVLASLFFYAWWEPIHLPLLLASIYINFRVGSTLNRKSASSDRVPARARLGLAIAFNLLLLGAFKYTGFVVACINDATGSAWTVPEIALPLGISFFTFTQIAWLVDRYRGLADDSPAIDYVLFVTYFPHLIAGPILHHREMMSQFASRWTHAVRYRNVLSGLFLFSIGLFKKVVLADTFSGWADSGFDSNAPLNFFESWSCSLAYTFQLYFDFSGYCDMALGISMLFNVRLPINFNSPYKALDIQDFWRRWHMTLSRYLRDYLYIPLGGSRAGMPREMINLMATFLVGGLWHGASWMFVIWGGLHGAALVLHRVWKMIGVRLPRAAGWLLTFLFVNMAWVFFRARSMSDARRVLGGMLDVQSVFEHGWQGIPTRELAWAGTLFDTSMAAVPTAFLASSPCIAAVALALIIVSRPNSMQLVARYDLMRTGEAATAALLCVGLLAMLASRTAVFLYFNF